MLPTNSFSTAPSLDPHGISQLEHTETNPVLIAEKEEISAFSPQATPLDVPAKIDSLVDLYNLHAALIDAQGEKCEEKQDIIAEGRECKEKLEDLTDQMEALQKKALTQIPKEGSEEIGGESGGIEAQAMTHLSLEIAEQSQLLEKLRGQSRGLTKEIADLKEGIQNCKNKMVMEEKALVTAINQTIGGEVIDETDLPVQFTQMSLPLKEQTMQDHIKNHAVVSLNNLIGFLTDKKAYLEEKKVALFHEFNPNSPLPESLEITLKLLGGDSHNGGASPLLLQFNDGKEVCLQVVYKPRMATTDKAILDLFSQLNELSTEKLPTYKIIDLGKEGSFWEYIEGMEPGMTSDASDCIQNFTQSLQENSGMKVEEEISGGEMGATKEAKLKALEQFTAQLERLHAVCKYAGISDLHGENVRFTGITREGKTFELITEGKYAGHFSIIPIDLEVVEKGDETGLMGQFANLKESSLTSQEKLLIDQFSVAQFDRISRVVPVPTAVLMNLLLDPEGIEKIPLTVCEALKSAKYEIVDEIGLMKTLASDVERRDIPYFTRKGENLFYGMTEIVIATRKE